MLGDAPVALLFERCQQRECGDGNCFPADPPSNAAGSAAAGTQHPSSQSCCCQVILSPAAGTQALQGLCLKAHSHCCEYVRASPQPLPDGTGDTSLDAAAQVLQEHAGQLGQVFIAGLHLGVADELPAQPAQLGHAQGPAEHQPLAHAGDADGLSGLSAAPLRGQHGGQHVLRDAVQLVQEAARLQRLRAGGAVRRRRGALEQRGADVAQRQLS